MCYVMRLVSVVFLLFSWIPLSLAQDAVKKQPGFYQFVPLIFVFLLLYILLIRPAQKRHKKHQELVNALKKGDQVITNSGILGTIYGLTDTFITLEVADNVRIRILRSQISSLADKELSQKH